MPLPMYTALPEIVEDLWVSAKFSPVIMLDRNIVRE